MGFELLQPQLVLAEFLKHRQYNLSIFRSLGELSSLYLYKENMVNHHHSAIAATSKLTSLVDVITKIIVHLSHEKNPLTFHHNGLFNRDPYNGLLSSPHKWVGFHPLYTLSTTRGPFFIAHLFLLRVFLGASCTNFWEIPVRCAQATLNISSPR